MPMPDEWRTHAKATRNEAARATRRGETDYARVLLKLAEQMESQAEMAVASPVRASATVGRARLCRLALIHCCNGITPASTPANDRLCPTDFSTDSGVGTASLQPEPDEALPHAY
jgi:hypothetical protein